MNWCNSRPSYVSSPWSRVRILVQPRLSSYLNFLPILIELLIPTATWIEFSRHLICTLLAQVNRVNSVVWVSNVFTWYTTCKLLFFKIFGKVYKLKYFETSFISLSIVIIDYYGNWFLYDWTKFNLNCNTVFICYLRLYYTVFNSIQVSVSNLIIVQIFHCSTDIFTMIHAAIESPIINQNWKSTNLKPRTIIDVFFNDYLIFR